VPQGSLDVREFFGETTGQRRTEILRRNQVDYVLAEKDSPLANWLERGRAFESVDTPGEGYELYAVDLGKLPLEPRTPRRGFVL
jgi:hypothetical protein